MVSKLLRWLREGAILAMALSLILLAMDYFRAPLAPFSVASETFITLNGESVTLDALSAEKPLLIYFWASWCGVCRFTTPKVAELASEGGNVLSIALRSGDDTKVQRYLMQKSFPLRTVNDASGAISARWQIGVTPTFVVMHKGEVVNSATGWSSLTGIKLRMWWASLR